MSTISYIIPSLNRESLHRTIASIEMREGDEICVEFDIPKSNMWGNPQRNKAMARATGDYLAFIDDDDFYVKGHREKMEKAIQEHPGSLLLFQMRFPNGAVLWNGKDKVPGNIGTPMILVPNDKSKLHFWKEGRNMADFIFVDHWKGDIVWIEEVLTELGHPYINFGIEYEKHENE